jgi:hypothetical protein
METIFTNSGVGGTGNVILTGEPGDPESYESRVRALIEDAVDFEQSYLAPYREENQAYYNGIAPALGGPDPDEEFDSTNKSSFISTDVRDTILAVIPSLIRIFTAGSEKIANFVPRREADQEMADQLYDYLNYVFYNDNEGFLMLHSVFKDALTVKGGITKWWTDTDTEIEENTYQNLSPEQYQSLIYEMGEDGEVTELEQTSEDVIDLVTIRSVVTKPVTKADAVPPDEFRISRDAKSVKSAGLVGHERLVPVSFLIQKGVDPDDIRANMTQQLYYSDERFLRNPGLVDERVIEGVQYGEFFIRIDGDGDGIDELHYICTMGSNYTIIHDRIVSHVNFALWGSDPRPHTAIGDCLADITKDIQKFKTNMMRGQLDNLAESMNPRTVVNELVTNIDDVLSDEVGAVIRTRGDPNAAVAFSKTPYAGAEVQVSIDYLDKVRASRTGITEASKGLDPKAMQSTALTGIDAIISGAQERIELIARILAETGLKPMLQGLAREIVNNPSPERTIPIRGKYVTINPSKFDPTMRVEINPTLGKGSDVIRLQALGSIENAQLMIIEKFGIANPIVTPQMYLNTKQDQLALANIKNFGRYFGSLTPEIMKAITEAPKEPDPATVLAQAELEKVKKDVLVATGKQENDNARLQLDTAVAKNDADFERDKLNVNAMLELAKIFGEKAANPQVPEGILSANQQDEGV